MASISLQHSGHSSGASCSLIATNECVVDDFTRLFCSIHARAGSHARTHTHDDDDDDTTLVLTQNKTKQNKNAPPSLASSLLSVRAPLFVSVRPSVRPSVCLSVSLSLSLSVHDLHDLMGSLPPRRPSSVVHSAVQRPEPVRPSGVMTCFTIYISSRWDGKTKPLAL